MPKVARNQNTLEIMALHEDNGLLWISTDDTMGATEIKYVFIVKHDLPIDRLMLRCTMQMSGFKHHEILYDIFFGA